MLTETQPSGIVRVSACLDKQILHIDLHPCGADGSTIARALAAIQGALQALEEGGRWPNPTTTTSSFALPVPSTPRS
jgi:hypothetical protein